MRRALLPGAQSRSRIHADLGANRPRSGWRTHPRSETCARFRGFGRRKARRKGRPRGTVRRLDRSSLLFSVTWNGGEGGIRSRGSHSLQRFRPDPKPSNHQIHSKPEYQVQNRYSATVPAGGFISRMPSEGSPLVCNRMPRHRHSSVAFVCTNLFVRSRRSERPSTCRRGPRVAPLRVSPSAARYKATRLRLERHPDCGLPGCSADVHPPPIALAGQALG